MSDEVGPMLDRGDKGNWLQTLWKLDGALTWRWSKSLRLAGVEANTALADNLPRILWEVEAPLTLVSSRTFCLIGAWMSAGSGGVGSVSEQFKGDSLRRFIEGVKEATATLAGNSTP